VVYIKGIKESLRATSIGRLKFLRTFATLHRGGGAARRELCATSSTTADGRPQAKWLANQYEGLELRESKSKNKSGFRNITLRRN